MSAGLHLSLEEFDRMVERGAFDHLNRKIELIRGELREMNPAGPVHDDLIIYLTNWSGRVLLDHPILVTAQTGLAIPELASRPEPDLMWVKEKRYRDGHAQASDVLLAIEVSDSSLKKDLGEKAELYAEAGITEYWSVDAASSCVHVFRNPSGVNYVDRSIANKGDSLSPLALDSAVLDVTDLFGE